MAPAGADRWVERGKGAIVALLEREHAAVWPEIEAKIADLPGDGHPQPHVLTKARRALEAEGLISSAEDPSRGGRQARTWHLTIPSGTEREVIDASARKRLLYVRFLGWNRPRSGYPNGLLGPAAEGVVHDALRTVAPGGYKLVRPEGGEVGHLLGAPVPRGPLDNAAFLQVLDPEGKPMSPLVVPIEVKNVRHWIYSDSSELFQLLFKAAKLQSNHPDLCFAPILVCRRRAYSAWIMGKELGFIPVEVRAQYVLPGTRISAQHFDEVKTELGYLDLTRELEPPQRLLDALGTSVPKLASEYAERWARNGPALVEYFDELSEYRPPHEQAQLMGDLRDEAAHLDGVSADDW